MNIFKYTCFMYAKSWHFILVPVIVLLSISSRCDSQPHAADVRHLEDNFSEMVPWVYNFCQDNQGYLWFGGEGAFQRYDGYSLKTYLVRDLFEKEDRDVYAYGEVNFLNDHSGGLWIFANNGIFKFCPEFNRFCRIRFKYPFEFFYGMENAAPASINIAAVMEDHLDNLWVGTDNGLLFYFSIDSVNKLLNGYTVPPEKISLDNKNIFPVKYRTEFMNEAVPEFRQIEKESNIFFCPKIVKILQDRDGDIWINTHCRIFRLTRRNNEWGEGGVYFKNRRLLGYTPFWTKNLFLDKDRNLWMGIQNFLVRKVQGKQISPRSFSIPASIIARTDIFAFDTLESPVNFHFEWYEFPHETGYQRNTSSVNNAQIFGCNQLFMNNENRLLNYSIVMNRKNEPVFHKILDLENNYLVENGRQSKLTGLFFTDEGLLFAGEWSHGVVTFDLNYLKMFRKLYNLRGDQTSLPGNTYCSMVDLGNNRLLFGAQNNSIYKTDYNFTSFEKLPLQIDFTGGTDNFIIKMIPDGYGRIWILNFLKQAAVFEEKCLSGSQPQNCSQQINGTQFGLKPAAFHGIHDIALDKNKTLWCSTDQGFYDLDIPRYRDTKYLKDIIFSKFNKFNTAGDSSLFQNIHHIISIDTDFFLLISTKGWLQFNPNNGNYWRIKNETNYGVNNPDLGFRVYETGNDDQIWTTDLSNISNIKFYSDGDYPPYKARVTSYTPADGFPFKPLEFITDDKNNLWIYPDTPNDGIIRYDPRNHNFQNFKGPGIVNGAIFGCLKGKDRSGRIYFGATDGITVFHPDSIKTNAFIPPTRITNIEIMHTSVFKRMDTTRLAEFKNSNTIILKPFENTIQIEFSALSYTSPKDNRYAFYLAGFDKDTIFTGASNRTATYSNLSPGKYKFFVKGSNNNSLWSPYGAQLQIIVMPPWYSTWVTYLVYAVLLIGFITGWRFYDLRRIRLKHSIELKNAETEKLKELDHLKSEFFSNISHEFRTPLTLILGPLEQIIRGNFTGDLHKEAEIMKRNGLRLLRLINQILNLSKLDAGKTRLQAQECDLSGYLRKLAANFESAARNQGIELSIYIPQKPVWVYIDIEKMDDILENVLGNALKFTLWGGKVIVRLRAPVGNYEEDVSGIDLNAEISIKDTGIGISEDNLRRIFDRFYQVESGHTRKHEGAGIGLSLVSELVKLHHGTISVKSKPGKGTIVAIILPLGTKHLSKEEIITDRGVYPEEKTAADRQLLTNELPLTHPAAQVREIKVKDESLPLILVVEDNRDMRNYIISNLNHQFTFIEAEDGLSGFDHAVQSIPDLILTDLMMPGMDGNEFCKKVKEDERTRHIPVIMLTAKAGKKDFVSGYDMGVDDYIIKPFDQDILRARINNLLRERKMLREKFTNHWVNAAPEMNIIASDNQFIIRLNMILEKNYGNPDFGPSRLIKESGMSRSVMYRKLKAVTNLSPNTYLRNFRLIKSYQAIRLGQGDISSAAYAAGFNNLSYFSRSFKKLFKNLPHDFYSRDRV